MAFLTLFNRRGGSFSPADLTGLAATVLPAESRAAGLLWQDTAKTIAATADGDPVRVAVCPYTAVEFTAPSDAARPLLYEEGGGKWSLWFDGVDDCLGRTATGISLPATFGCGFILDGDGVIVEGFNNVDFRRLGGSLQLAANAVLGPACSTGAWHTAVAVANTAASVVRLDGAETTGDIGAFGSVQQTSIGRRVSEYNPLSGRITGVVIAATAAGAAERTALESYLAALTP